MEKVKPLNTSSQKYKFEVVTLSELMKLASEERLREEGVIPGQISLDDQ